MMVIGITGGFSSGKSYVAKEFKKKGAFIIDADKIVHSLYDNNIKVKHDVIRVFGKNVLKNGKIDRKRLSKEAFRSKENINKLCTIIYPETIKKIKKEINKNNKKIIALEAPLLVEAGES
jgi:dephospho-CoA kinase